MSRKCLIERNNKRFKLLNKNKQKHNKIKEQISVIKSRIHQIKSNKNSNAEELLNCYRESYLLCKNLSTMPANSSKVRVRNRCKITGRPRGYYRYFGLSRIMLRQLGGNGEICGLIKSSW